MAVTKQLHITGRVQGVGFRYALQREALARGLAGWVRNRRDGSVEALFAGPAEAVERMLEACRVGPSRARVDAVARHAAEDDGVAGFRQLPTG